MQDNSISLLDTIKNTFSTDKKTHVARLVYVASFIDTLSSKEIVEYYDRLFNKYHSTLSYEQTGQQITGEDGTPRIIPTLTNSSGSIANHYATGILLVYPSTFIHFIEAPSAILNKLVQHLHPAGEWNDKTVRKQNLTTAQLQLPWPPPHIEKISIIANMEDVPRCYPTWFSRTLSASRGEYAAVGGDISLEHLSSDIYLDMLQLGRVSTITPPHISSQIKFSFDKYNKLTSQYFQQKGLSTTNMMEGLMDTMHTKFKSLVPTAPKLTTLLSHPQSSSVSLFSSSFLSPINFGS